MWLNLLGQALPRSYPISSCSHHAMAGVPFSDEKTGTVGGETHTGDLAPPPGSLAAEPACSPPGTTQKLKVVAPAISWLVPFPGENPSDALRGKERSGHRGRVGGTGWVSAVCKCVLSPPPTLFLRPHSPGSLWPNPGQKPSGAAPDPAVLRFVPSQPCLF